MGMCRVANVAGAAFGWLAAGMLALDDGVVQSRHVVPFMLISLSVALFTSAALVFARQQAPLGVMFEIGYNAGRKDAIREASTRSGSVSPIRRVPNGLGAFNREKIGS